MEFYVLNYLATEYLPMTFSCVFWIVSFKHEPCNYIQLENVRCECDYLSLQFPKTHPLLQINIQSYHIKPYY